MSNYVNSICRYVRFLALDFQCYKVQIYLQSFRSNDINLPARLLWQKKTFHTFNKRSCKFISHE